MTESAVTRSCLSYLGQLPTVKIWRNHTGTGLFMKGTPMYLPVGIPSQGGGGDFIGFEILTIEGKRVARFLSVEFKRDRGGVTGPKQKAWRAFVESHGGRAVVIDSLETCKKVFPVSASC